MATGSHNGRNAPALALILLAIIAGSAGASSGDEEREFVELKRLADSGSGRSIAREAREFLKRYPSGRHAADAKFIGAEYEADPSRSLESFRSIMKEYPRYPKRDEAQQRICSILYLLSRWGELEKESSYGARIFAGSPRAADFLLFHAKACIFLSKYGDAAKSCSAIADKSHDYATLSEALLLLSYINRNTSGYSKSYLSGLRDLITGFGNSNVTPTAIYLLGRCYEDKRDYDRAYSAYTDVSKRYPRSPEARYVEKRIDSLMRHRPSTVDYMPTDESISASESIDIRPEMAISEHSGKSASTYSVSLGPLESKSEAKKIQKLIKNEFNPVRIIKVQGSYLVYAGAAKNPRKALEIKIRLAEEFGLNGRVVRIVSDTDRTYIYGD